MASTFTTNLNLELQATGENSGTWGTILNTAALAIIDQAMGGVQTLTLSSSNVTVNTAQSQNNYIKLTGVLSANVDVTFPAIGRTYFIANNTTGDFTVTLKCAGAGTSAVIPRGYAGFYVLDAVNIVADPPYFGAQANLAGAATTSLGTIPSRNVSITGTGWTITSFGSVASTVAPIYMLNFVSTGTLTYNATSMILPGAANIAVAAGDTAIALYLGSGNWKIISYTPAAVSPSTSYGYISTQVITATGTYTPTTGTRYIRIRAVAGGGGGGGAKTGDGDSATAGGSGGSGQYFEGGVSIAALITAGFSGGQLAITIGAAGAGGSSSGGNGTVGGNTSITSLLTLVGGGGGEGDNTTGYGGGDGAAGGTGGSITAPLTGLLMPGNGGGPGSGSDQDAGNYTVTSQGGASPFGGSGRGQFGRGNYATAGISATGYGSAGSGAMCASVNSGNNGGNGFGGLVIIDEYS